ncbi:MAG: c-type cytochrome [Acidobacteriaceae bacterium]|nr:c-type cytochrome [Acidobacteriaceae bacterium]
MKLARLSSLLMTVAWVFSSVFVSGADRASETPPVWAYGTDPSAAAIHGKSEPAAKDRLLHLPGTDLAFTAAQIQDHFHPADWYPGDHPTMPDIVAHGRPPQVWACALCHYPNGRGKPENAAVAGLPVSYFVEQMHEFRDGQRKSADARKGNTALMSAFAKAMTDGEIQEAAEYFARIQWTPWIQVVETETVPKTRTSVGMYMPIPGGGTEPLGRRIIEVPVDPEGTETWRNPRSGFIAYVPLGSIQKGRKLVANGGSKTTPCALCHGADLAGLGPVAGIAGRSPSYLVRQLYDMQKGTRKGTWTELMKPVVRNLTEDDMLNIAAYTSSLRPESGNSSRRR